MSQLAGDLSGIKSFVLGSIGGLSSQLAAGSAISSGLFTSVLEGQMTMATAMTVAYNRGKAAIDEFIQSAISAEQRTAKTTALLRGTGESAGWSAAQLNQMAKDMAGIGTASQGSIKEAQNALLVFKNIRGDQFEAVLKASVNMESQFGSVESAAQTLGRALENPGHGLERLKRQGIDFSETQKHQIKTMMDQNNVAGAQKVVLDELAKKYGGLGEEMRKTTGGQLQLGKNQMDGIKLQLGQAFLPLATSFLPVMQKIVDTVTANMGGIQSVAQKVIGFAQQIASVGAYAIDLFNSISPETKKIIADLVATGAAVGAMAGAFSLVMPWVTPIVGAVFSLLSPIGLVIGAVTAMGVRLYTVFGESSERGQKLRDTFQVVKDAAQKVMAIVFRIGEVLASAFGPVSDELLKATTAGFTATADAAQKVWDISVGWIADFVSKNQQLLVATGLWAGGLLLAYGAVQLVIAGVSTLFAVLSAMGAGQILSTVLWLAWNAVVLTAQGIMLLYNVQVALYNGFMALATATTALFTTAEGAATIGQALFNVATMATNVALGIMNVLLAPVTLLAFAGAIVVVTFAVQALVVTFATLIAGVVAVFGAVSSLAGLLMSMPTTYGPIAHIGSLFQEWGGIISSIVTAIKTDMPLAIELMKLSFALAISQIKDLWPGFWEFLQKGFRVTFTAIAENLYDQIKFAADKARNHLDDWIAADEVVAARNATDERKKKELDERVAGRLADVTREMNATAKRIDAEFKESDETKELRKKVTDKQEDVKKAVAKKEAAGRTKIGTAWTDEDEEAYAKLHPPKAPTPDPKYDEKTKDKFAFSGFADMSKKIQESITGVSMMGLVTKQLVEAKNANGFLKDVVQNGKDVVAVVNNLKPGFGN